MILNESLDFDACVGFPGCSGQQLCEQSGRGWKALDSKLIWPFRRDIILTIYKTIRPISISIVPDRTSTMSY